MARVQLQFPDKVVFKCSFEVRVNDLNYGNHLANQHILTFAHESRVKWFESLGYSEMDIEGVGVIQADAAIIYKKEAFLGDTLTFELGIGEVGRASFEVFYRIINQNKEVVALAKTGMLTFNYTERKPVSIPEKFAQFIS